MPIYQIQGLCTAYKKETGSYPVSLHINVDVEIGKPLSLGVLGICKKGCNFCPALSVNGQRLIVIEEGMDANTIHGDSIHSNSLSKPLQISPVKPQVEERESSFPG